MQLKTDVLISGVQPEMLLCLMIIEPLFDDYEADMVITSCRDGEHSQNSKHKLGCAVDIRSRELDDSDKVSLAQSIRAALTSEFFVLLEDDHFHVQFNGVGL
ncbi:MAG TPA: hypothetical protein EYQ14_07255 [Gammaproteobacteria bacterium]|nr:hypothetical protein [Gammaproteobacteria bacterium]HIL18212.1 hypothetical protein [Gammaproteobacteria bacterium]